MIRVGGGECFSPIVQSYKRPSMFRALSVQNCTVDPILDKEGGGGGNLPPAGFFNTVQNP